MSLQNCRINIQIVIVTTVFSMGIDYPDVYRIIHYGPPSHLEDYVQETERVGRDGSQSHGYITVRKAKQVCYLGN